MNRKPSRLWFSFLKIVLRRNRTRSVFWALIFFIPAFSAAGAPILLAQVSRDFCLISFRQEGNEEERERVSTRIREGMTSAIQYEIRVLRTGSPLGLASRLVYSDDIFYEGFLDPFTGMYALSRKDDSRLFSDGTAFLDEFFSLNHYSLSLEDLPEGDYDIRIRAKLRAVKLLPPLNFLAPLQALGWLGLSWSVQPVKIEKEPSD